MGQTIEELKEKYPQVYEYFLDVRHKPELDGFLMLKKLARAEFYFGCVCGISAFGVALSILRFIL